MVSPGEFGPWILFASDQAPIVRSVRLGPMPGHDGCGCFVDGREDIAIAQLIAQLIAQPIAQLIAQPIKFTRGRVNIVVGPIRTRSIFSDGVIRYD